MTNSDSRIFRHIVDAIATGELRAGSRIFEPELSEHFGVSRTPIRQALSRLVQEGILEKQAKRRGYKVPQLTPEDMDQVFVAREAVEGQVVALACRNATEADIQWLLKVNEEERLRFEKGDKAEYAATNEGFHFFLSSLSRNKYLQRYYSQLYWRTQLYIFHLAGFYARVDAESIKKITELSYVEHRELIEVLARGDEEEARRAAVEHVRSTRMNRIHPALLGEKLKTSI